MHTAVKSKGIMPGAPPTAVMRLADLGDEMRWVAVLGVCSLARGGDPLGEGVAAQGVP